MKKTLSLILSAILFTCFTFAQETTNISQLAAKYGFKFGGVTSATQISIKAYQALLKNDFNSVTASNEFKAYSLLNQQRSIASADGMPVMMYNSADRIAKFASENGLQIRGHVLVWDAYMCDWFFREGYTSNGKYVDKETMEKRLAYYIDEVITHFETNFPGVVYCWDVVNEAVADGGGDAIPGDKRMVRKSRSGSTNLFYEHMGPDYVEFAFKCAKETVNRVNPEIKLFYNDYNTYMAGKRQAICNLIKSINKDEKLCDGVGMQCYIGGYGTQNGCMNFNDITTIKASIREYASLGIEVHITEMAVRNYLGDEKTMKVHTKFYESLFTELKTINTPENSPLTCVAIWGLCDNPNLSKDNYSYKMNGPYCGIYTQKFAKKSEYDAIVKALSN